MAGEARLLRASRRGDHDAFARIVRRYQSLVCAITYGATANRDKSKCRHCRCLINWDYADGEPSEMDHIHPLALVDRSWTDAWWYWTADNLQTLCIPCHRKKTITDLAAIRASRVKPVSRETSGQRQLFEE